MIRPLGRNAEIHASLIRMVMDARARERAGKPFHLVLRLPFHAWSRAVDRDRLRVVRAWIDETEQRVGERLAE